MNNRPKTVRMFRIDNSGTIPVTNKDIPRLERIGEKVGTYIQVLNFCDVEQSMRFNPVQYRYLANMQDCMALADNIMHNSFCIKDYDDYRGKFFERSASNFLAAVIYFFVNYKRMPYRSKYEPLWPEYYTDPQTKHRKLTGRAFDTEKHRDAAEAALAKGIFITEGLTEPTFWLGKYSDFPHVLTLLNHDYCEIFETLKTETELCPILKPFITAYENKAMEQLEGMLGTLRVQISRMATKDSFWILQQEQDDFTLYNEYDTNYVAIVTDNHNDTISRIYTSLVLNIDKLPNGIELNACNRTVRRILDYKRFRFESENVREKILYDNYRKVWEDIDTMIKEIIEEQIIK